MTLEKAIEIVIANVKAKPPGLNHDYFDALKLLAEAGKVLQHGRLIGSHHDPALLPGETKE